MVQAAFEFPSQPVEPAADRAPAHPGAAAAGTAEAAAGDALDRTGFEIGRDHARHRVTPPLRHLHGDNPVRQGWERGRALFGSRTLRASAAVRQWLALRLEAWQHGQAFEDVQVNPAFLASIDAVDCPVTRQTLTLAAGHDSDATVQRLNPAAAYAAGNLAVLSRRAAQARDSAGCTEALARAQRLADGGEPAAADGLDAAAWQRLAVLASFATPLPHAQAAALPLCVLPPNRVRVINPVQALQLVLTLQFTTGGYARRLMALSALAPGGHELRQAFQVFMHTLLARRLAAGPGATAAELRRTLEDAWTDPLLQRRWQRLAGRLTAADCALWLQRAAARGLVVGGGRWLSDGAATEGWDLAGPAGRVPAAPPAASPAEASPVPAQAAAGSALSRPGRLRSRGSQKRAS